MARPNHITALREEFKEVMREYRSYHNKRAGDRRIARLYERMPMRQLWHLTHLYVRSFQDNFRERWMDDEMHRLDMLVFRTGAKLYSARNPKLAQQLIMESLTRK